MPICLIIKIIMFLGSRVRPAGKADSLTAVCELIRQFGIRNISQPYMPVWPVTGIAFYLYFTLYYDCFCNPNSVAISSSTFRKVCRNVYSGM
jgi:hypothetical protein